MIIRFIKLVNIILENLEKYIFEGMDDDVTKLLDVKVLIKRILTHTSFDNDKQKQSQIK